MATMASTSHSLSVWANTCVKNPINPKTGLSATIQDRNAVTIRFDDALNEVERSRNVLANSTDWVSGGRPTVNEKLQSVQDDDFYEKLQQLKEENKKTLEAYKKLYQEKMLLEDLRSGQLLDFQYDKSGVDRISSQSNGLSVTGVGKNGIQDDVEHVTTKPPRSKTRAAPSDTPVLSKTLPQKSPQSLRKERPRSAPLERKSADLDNEEYEIFFSKVREVNDDDNFVIPMNDSLSEYERAMAKVDKLWEDFKISEYTQRRHSFSAAGSKNKSQDKKSKTSEWRHRITIPQPFNMSVREALKEKKKTTAQYELELRRLEKEKQDEAECAKKFKAQPVPSHVYLPMYEEIMERNETRRQYVKQYCQEMLRSQVKPFNFDKREQEKKLQRAQSALIPKPEKPKNKFKAKPPPRELFSHGIDEKLMADEELRKIRIRMRSKELLREASLPPNMAAREKLKEQDKKEKAKVAKQAAKKRRPRSAHPVPDYDVLYKEFQKELARRKARKEGTVLEPFELETGRIRSSRDKIRRDIEDDERRLKENRWPFQNSRMTPRSSLKYLGALSNSLDSIPAMSTRSADLRTTMTKRERERLEQRRREEEEAERRKKMRESKFRRHLSERTESGDLPHPRDSIAERLKRIKREDRERQEAYQREIEEMKMRVDESPLLVEKYIAERAKRDAERKFTTTVRSAGLNDQEFVSARSSRAPASVRSRAYESDESFGDNQAVEDSPVPSGSADLTYTKSGSGDEEN